MITIRKLLSGKRLNLKNYELIMWRYDGIIIFMIGEVVNFPYIILYNRNNGVLQTLLSDSPR